jgi:hypothetical protein
VAETYDDFSTAGLANPRTDADGPVENVNEEETEVRDDQALPGAPKNEFEALKENLLKDGAEVDEVIVNEDVINDDEVNDGSLFHEHTNYDTMVLNHPGGPYLTDVDNARNAAYAERRMAQSEGNEEEVANLDLAAAQTEQDAIDADLARNQANADIAEREGRLRSAAESEVVPAMKEHATTGRSVDEILGRKDLPEASPSGVNPPPAPTDTVPGLDDSTGNTFSASQPEPGEELHQTEGTVSNTNVGPVDDESVAGENSTFQSPAKPPTTEE